MRRTKTENCLDNRARGGSIDPDPALIRKVFNLHLGEIRSGKKPSHINPRKFEAGSIKGKPAKKRADRKMRG
jgi:hypothetical protein